MGGQRLRMAKALATATCTVAREHGRQTRCVSFAHEAERHDTSQPSGLAAFMASYLNGGTSFEEALREARQVFEDEGKPFSQADILFLTDGECRVGGTFVITSKPTNIANTKIVIARTNASITLSLSERPSPCRQRAQTLADVQPGRRWSPVFRP